MKNKGTLPTEYYISPVIIVTFLRISTYVMNDKHICLPYLSCFRGIFIWLELSQYKGTVANYYRCCNRYKGSIKSFYCPI